MRRRKFIALSVAIVMGQALRAKGQTKSFRIGYIAATSPEATPELLTSLREGLRERGYVEGHNLSIEHRWAEQPSEALVADLLRARVDVIVAWGTHAVAAAKRTTSVTPIVMVGIADPIGAGFVASLAALPDRALLPSYEGFEVVPTEQLPREALLLLGHRTSFVERFSFPTGIR
jgi:putative ABC transport system substrate-binding protein